MKDLKPLGLLARLIWKENPSAFFWLMIQGLVSTIHVLFTVSIPKQLIDAWLKESPPAEFLKLILFISLVKYLLSVLKKIIDNKQLVQKEVLQTQYVKVFAHKVMSIDYCALEDPETLDLRERGFFALANYGAFPQLYAALVSIISGIFTLLSVTVLLIRFDLLTFLAILLLSLWSVFLSQKGLKVAADFMKRIVPVNRVYNYYFNKAYENAPQKDYRMFNVGDLIVNLVRDLNAETNVWLQKMRLANGKISSLQTGLQYLISLIIMIVAALKTQGITGSITVGDFTFYVGLALQFSVSFLAFASGFFKIAQNLNMLEPFTDFMELPDSQRVSGRKQPESFRSLQFEHVSFCYPKTEKPVLKDLNFTIHQGEHISLVGINHAGKTTIVKLISRLFEPTEGRILYNGVPIADYDYEAYLKTIATVFQDFRFFPFTIRENLGRQAPEEDIYRVLKNFGMKDKIEVLPKQLDTSMTKQLEEDAIDFSGGELQKLAIARSMLKQAELLILDEPTAALDPLAESEVYEHFGELSKGKTTIFISHRMSSSLFSDKILLLDEGTIQAFAPHKELMKTDNMYRRLFEAQAAHYRQT